MHLNTIAGVIASSLPAASARDFSHNYTVHNPDGGDSMAGTGGTSNQDNYGIAVACNDTHTAVGAYGNGEVYIYTNSTGALERTLTGSNFSDQLSMTADHLLITPNGGGTLKIFRTSDWSDLSVSNTSPSTPGYGGFGDPTAMSSTHFVVGIPNETYKPGWSSNYPGGRAVLYAVPSSSASSVATGTSIPNPGYGGGAYNAVNDRFGYAVATAGSYMAISQPYQDMSWPGTLSDAGRVYVYSNTGTSIRTIDPPSSAGSSGTPITQNNARFGYRLGMSASYMCVGFDGGTYNPRLYDNSTGNYLREFVPSSGWRGDMEIAMTDTITMISSPTQVDGTDRQGVVHYFENTTGTLLATVQRPGSGTVVDRFGQSLAISDSASVIGHGFFGGISPTNGYNNPAYLFG
jgi:hypothetical protein